jgi:hypothetical protein
MSAPLRLAATLEADSSALIEWVARENTAALAVAP